MASKMHASHTVEPHQEEPGMVQADQHVLDTVLMNLDLEIALALTNRIELGIRLPFRQASADAKFLDETEEEIPDFTSIHHRDEVLRGLGDVTLKAKYRLILPTSERSLLIDLNLALSLPTGGIEDDPFELGRQRKEHQHVFFGTGTFDPSLGLIVGYRFEQMMLAAEILWRGSVYPNERDYQGPQVVLGRLNADIPFLEKWSVRTGVELYQEWPAQWSGQNARNSGRLDLTPLVAISWSPTEMISSYLLFKRPIVIDVSGGQVSLPFVVGAGLSASFDLWSADPHKE